VILFDTRIIGRRFYWEMVLLAAQQLSDGMKTATSLPGSSVVVIGV
jgi:hypothetical protein